MAEQQPAPRPTSSYQLMAVLLVLSVGLALLVIGWLAGRAGFP